MDLNSLLQNETLKGLLAKAGVSPEQASSVLNTALTTIKSKFDKDPSKMSSLLSENQNTEDDLALAGSVENDFLQGISKKLGLPATITDKLKGVAMPEILKSVTGGLSNSGKNNEGGISSMLSGVMDMFDGDNKTKSGGGLMGMLSGFVSKFFAKK